MSRNSLGFHLQQSMLSAQKQMCRTLPPLISQPRKKKDEIHNAVLEKDSQTLTWTSSEVEAMVCGWASKQAF